MLQDANHLVIGNFRIVNQKLFMCAFEEIAEHLPGIGGADDKRIQPTDVGDSLAICLYKLDSLSHALGFFRDDSEPAAAIDVQVREVEGEDVQRSPVNNDD